MIRLMESLRNCLINFLLKQTSTNTSTLTLKLLHALPAIDPLMVDLGHETRNKSIAEVIEKSDAAAEEANQSKGEPEIVTNKDQYRNITPAEALKKLDEVKSFIEVNGSDHLNMIFN